MSAEVLLAVSFSLFGDLRDDQRNLPRNNFPNLFFIEIEFLEFCHLARSDLPGHQIKTKPDLDFSFPSWSFFNWVLRLEQKRKNLELLLGYLCENQLCKAGRDVLHEFWAAVWFRQGRGGWSLLFLLCFLLVFSLFIRKLMDYFKLIMSLAGGKMGRIELKAKPHLLEFAARLSTAVCGLTVETTSDWE